MSTCQIHEAKARLSELIREAQVEPLVILNRNVPVAALIGIDRWRESEELRKLAARPTMNELLDDLCALQDEGDLVIPERGNRSLPAFLEEGELP